MSNTDKALKAQLRAQYGEGNVSFAATKVTGLMAFRHPGEEEYLDFIGSVGAPQESSGVAREQFVDTCRVYPVEPAAIGKFRRALRAMPLLAGQLATVIEASAVGDFEDYKPGPEERNALDAKYEFGWDGIVPAGHPPIILASNETSGALVRVANDARENGDRDNGRKIRAAVLAMVRECDVSSVEALLGERPALLKVLWYRAQELAGLCVIELGKD